MEYTGYDIDDETNMESDANCEGPREYNLTIIHSCPLLEQRDKYLERSLFQTSQLPVKEVGLWMLCVTKYVLMVHVLC